jgi:hypothetical protein
MRGDLYATPHGCPPAELVAPSRTRCGTDLRSPRAPGTPTPPVRRVLDEGRAVTFTVPHPAPLHMNQVDRL